MFTVQAKIGNVDFTHDAVTLYPYYHQLSNIRRTESPNIEIFRLVLQSFLPNPLNPGVKLRMKM